MTKPRLLGLQLLFGWMNLVLAVPGIHLLFGMPLVMRQHGWSGTEIGLFQLAALPAICKFLFAVPVQRVRLGRGYFVHWLLLLGALLLALYWLVGRHDLIGAVWLYLKPLMLDMGMPLERVAFIVGIVGIVGGMTGALALLTLTVWAELGSTWLIASAICVAASMGAISALMFGLTMFFTRRQRNATDYGLQTTVFTVACLAAIERV